MENISLEKVKGYNPNYAIVSSHGYKRTTPHLVAREEDSFEKLIFAPDPVTGVPRSDLAFVVNSKTRPEVLQYIQNTLQRPLQDSVVGSDPDMAIASIRGRKESFTAYADRIREIINSQSEKK